MKCGNCGKTLDGHLCPADGETTPQEGDISICLYCGEITQFKDGKLEVTDINDLPKETQAEIETCLHVRKEVMNK